MVIIFSHGLVRSDYDVSPENVKKNMQGCLEYILECLQFPCQSFQLLEDPVLCLSALHIY